MSIQASHHIYLWNLPSSCAFFSPSLSPPLSPFPPPRCPLPIFPPFPIALLSISSLPCPPPHCQPLPVPIAPLPIAPFQIPPPCLHPPPPPLPPPLPITPPSCPPSPPPTSHSPPRFQPLPAPQHPFPHCPSPHRQLGSLIDSNQVCPTYQ